MFVNLTARQVLLNAALENHTRDLDSHIFNVRKIEVLSDKTRLPDLRPPLFGDVALAQFPQNR